MNLIPIAPHQPHRQQQAEADPIPLPSALDSLTEEAKFCEFLYDLQLEGGQHILPLKMAEALSRILEVDARQEQWLV